MHCVFSNGTCFGLFVVSHEEANAAAKECVESVVRCCFGEQHGLILLVWVGVDIELGLQFDF